MIVICPSILIKLFNRTTTELQYQSIISAMDQIVLETEQLAMQFEKQIRDKVTNNSPFSSPAPLFNIF